MIDDIIIQLDEKGREDSFVEENRMFIHAPATKVKPLVETFLEETTEPPREINALDIAINSPKGKTVTVLGCLGKLER